MENKRLFNKDFTLVVIGQIISLFGNAIMRLALPLYLLDLTGSAAIYGTALACSMIPMILLSPIGGIIADRINKRNIMVILDFSTAALLALFSLSVNIINPTVAIIITMMILFGIQALYQPAVQGSMPLLADEEHLLAANSIINQVSALSGLIGPAIGGMVYGMVGIWPVVIIGGLCFTLSAIMEIFIVIPHTKQNATGSMLHIAKQDLKEGMHFVLRERPVIIKVALVCAAFNLFLSSMMMVGMPTIIKINLNLSNELYGYAEASLGAGSLIGGICVGIMGKRFCIEKSYKLLILSSMMMLPVCLVVALNMHPLFIYGVIVLCCTLCLAITMIFTILALTYVQEETPMHLLGKVIACVMAICMCSQPVGQAIYGVLFENMKEQPAGIILGATIICTGISIGTRGIFSHIEHSHKISEEIAIEA